MEINWGSILVLIFLIKCQGQTPPYLIDDTESTIIVAEATPVGTLLRTLKATDDDGDGVIVRYPDYDIPTKDLIIINQTSYGSMIEADLILNKTLDRDFNADARKLHIILEDDSANTFQIVVVIDLYITDVNDERPAFLNLPYRFDLREDHKNMTIIYRNIKAIDPDNGMGGRISYTIQPVTQSTQDAHLFLATYSIDNVTGDLTLTQSLDYEQMQVFQFNVIAQDGYGLNTTEVLTIRILDVQDTPPIFLGTPYVVTVTENIPVGTHFYTIRSMDGDRGVPNTVQFVFLDGPCASVFDINNATGEVTVSDIVDRDIGEVMENGGVCEIRVMVSEIEANFPQLGPSTAVTSLSIYVGDQNDNQPSFNLPSYSAYISNTALLNYPIQFENKTELFIEDLDQGSSGILELYLRSQDGDLTFDFEPIPSVIASNGRPLITLKSPKLLLTREQIILYIKKSPFGKEMEILVSAETTKGNTGVFAVERDTTESYSASATITVRVLPVATTTVTTTTIRTTTPVYLDPFIPSILGVVIAFLLLVWAILATVYYCYKYKRIHSNRVGDCGTRNGTNHTGLSNGSESPVMNHPPPNRNGHLLPTVFQSVKTENGDTQA